MYKIKNKQWGSDFALNGTKAAVRAGPSLSSSLFSQQKQLRQHVSVSQIHSPLGLCIDAEDWLF